jgi:hypothetical protein
LPKIIPFNIFNSPTHLPRRHGRACDADFIKRGSGFEEGDSGRKVAGLIFIFYNYLF